MKLLSSYGAIWKLSDRNYRKFLKDAAKAKPWHLDDYGKCIISSDVLNVTDFTPEDAIELLKRKPQ